LGAAIYCITMDIDHTSNNGPCQVIITKEYLVASSDECGNPHRTTRTKFIIQ